MKYGWTPLKIRRRGRIIITKQRRVDALGFGWIAHSVTIRRKPPVRTIVITWSTYEGKNYLDARNVTLVTCN